MRRKLTAHAAQQHLQFLAFQRQKRLAVEAIWARAKHHCEVCGVLITPPGQTIHDEHASFLVFQDERHPTAETGQLRCRSHYRRPVF